MFELSCVFIVNHFLINTKSRISYHFCINFYNFAAQCFNKYISQSYLIQKVVTFYHEAYISAGILKIIMSIHCIFSNS